MEFSWSKIVEYTLSGFLIVAIISVLVAKNSNAPAFLQTLGSSLSSILGSVVAPATQAASATSTNAASAGSSNLLGSANIAGITASTNPATTGATSANTGTTTVN